jgi:hypothetical protein
MKTMASKCETLSINVIYHLLDIKNGDKTHILDIAKQAYNVAKHFEFINKEWIAKYLNDELALDSLCNLSLKANILTEGDFSVSHTSWLNRLRQKKLDLHNTQVTVSNIIVEDLYEDLLKLQSLCSLYPKYCGR